MSSNKNPRRAKVRHTPIPRWSAAPALAALESVCRAGARSSTVLLSPSCREAHHHLETAIATANDSLSRRQSLAGTLMVACQTLEADAGDVVVAIRLHETAVGAVARGDAAVIRAAGFQTKAGARPDAPAVLRRTRVSRLEIPDVLDLAGRLCDAGDACRQVQESQAAKRSLGRLRKALAAARGSLDRKRSVAAELEATSLRLKIERELAVSACRVYEDMVGRASGGDAARINEAGLASSEDQPPTIAIPRKVTGLRGKAGKHAREAMLSWDGMRGATGYAVQVKYAPDVPESPWVAPAIGNRRAYRLVTAVAPHARFLARVAAVDNDGALAEWSDPILVTAC
jgi:hypothetical protein